MIPHFLAPRRQSPASTLLLLLILHFHFHPSSSVQPLDPFTDEDCQAYAANPFTLPEPLAVLPGMDNPERAPYFYLHERKQKEKHVNKFLPHGAYEIVIDTTLDGPHSAMLLKDSARGLPPSHGGGQQLHMGSCFSHALDFEPRNVTALLWTPPMHLGQKVSLEVVVVVHGQRRWYSLELETQEPECKLEELEALLEPRAVLGQCWAHSAFASDGGRFCLFQCKPGYAARAGTHTYCDKNGKWQPKPGSSFDACAVIADFCKEDEIGEDRKYRAGGLVCKHAAVGEKCEYSCAPGHRAGDAVECLTSGKFSRPQCEYVGPCAYKTLAEGKGMMRKGTCRDLMPGEVCSYQCAEGYSPKANEIYCSERGWLTQAECQIIPDYCSVDDIKGEHVLPGTCTDRSVLDNSFCQFACEKGYTPILAKLRCSPRGKRDSPETGGWNHGPFECRAIQPKEPVKEEL